MRAYLKHFRERAWRRWALLAATILLWLATMSMGSVPANANSGYDNRSPVQAGCSPEAIAIGGTSSVTINSFSGTIQFYTSPRCPYAIWGGVAITSGASNQYRVTMELTRADPQGSSFFQETVNSSLLQGNMLSDQGSCIQAMATISTVSGETTSTIGEEFCNQAAPPGAPPVVTPPPAESTTTTTSTQPAGSSSPQTETMTVTSKSESAPATSPSSPSKGSKPGVGQNRKVHHKKRRAIRHRKHKKHRKSIQAHP